MFISQLREQMSVSARAKMRKKRIIFIDQEPPIQATFVRRIIVIFSLSVSLQ